MPLGDQVLIPISVESFGFVHDSAIRLMSALCHKASSISDIPHSVLLNYWRNSLSVTLQKNVAKMMIARVDRIVSSTTRNVKAADYVPHYDDFNLPS